MKFGAVTLISLAGMAQAIETMEINSPAFRSRRIAKKLRRQLEDAQNVDAADADAADGEADDQGNGAGNGGYNQWAWLSYFKSNSGNAAGYQYDNDEAEENGVSYTVDASSDKQMELAGSIQFKGCHAFTTTLTDNQQYQYDQNQYQNQYESESIISYVVLEATVPNYNNGYYGDEEDMTTSEIALPIATYMALLADEKLAERESLCDTCQQVPYYCLPQEEENLGQSGGTKIFDQYGNVISHVTWNQPWDYTMSEKENMGDYYGLNGALSCVSCLQNGCYDYNDYKNQLEYMAQNTFNMADYDTLVDRLFGQDVDMEEVENYIELMEESIDQFSQCSQIDGTQLFGGWTCASSGHGVQYAVFTDDECTMYTKLNYEDFAQEADIEAFLIVTETLAVEDNLSYGTTCAANKYNVGSDLEARYKASTDGKNFWNGYYNPNGNFYGDEGDEADNADQNDVDGEQQAKYHQQMLYQVSDVCQALVNNNLQGEIKLDDACATDEDGQAKYQSQASEVYNNAVSGVDYGDEHQSELDLYEFQHGNYADFCLLIAQDFGSTYGNQRIQDGNQRFYDKSSGFLANASTGVKVLFVAFIVLVVVGFAVVAGMAIRALHRKNSGTAEQKEPLTPAANAEPETSEPTLTLA